MEAELIKEFFLEEDGHPLLTWRRRLEKASAHHSRFQEKANLKVSLKDFVACAAALGYTGDARKAFQDMDQEHTGYLTLHDFDVPSDDLWTSFRRWCGRTFTSASDMCLKLCSQLGSLCKPDGRNGALMPAPAASYRRASRDDGGVRGFSKSQFIANAARLGWYAGHEETLFDALDIDGAGHVAPELLQWFDGERKRELKRTAAKIRSGKRGSLQSGMRHRVNAMQSLQAFVVFLRLRYGCLFRAWRDALDRDGCMHVGRMEIVQACRALNWSGDVNLLWKSLDPDETGKTSIDWLDPDVARTLALFKRWYDQSFGNARSLMKAIDAVDLHKLREGILNLEEWEAACKEVGCPCDAVRVFEILDWDSRHCLGYSDVKCLDRWTPLPYLMAEADEEAAADFKSELLEKYTHALPAWRMGVDRDGCGRAYWNDFKWAAENISFEGNLEGAWLAMDADNSGYITLHELDKDAAESLVCFRRWARQRFGGVLVAFTTLTNSQDSVSVREFKKILRQNGFRGNAEALFRGLDVDGSGDLGLGEVAFLDEWDLADVEEAFGGPVSGVRRSSGGDHIKEVTTGKRFSIGKQTKSSAKEEEETCSAISGFRLLQFIGWSSDHHEFHRIAPDGTPRRYLSKMSHQESSALGEVYVRPILPQRWGKVPPCIGGRPYIRRSPPDKMRF